MNQSVEEGGVVVVEDGPRVGNIFVEFLRLGLTAFGGPAIVAHIKELAVGRKKWLDEVSFKDGVVLSQSIPGATAMQVAAYVGLKTKGIRGAAAAFVGLGLPAFFLMLLLSEFYSRSRSITPVLALFGGLQVIVVAVVAHAAQTFGRDIARSLRSLLVAAASAAALFFGADPFLVIVGSALAGMLLFRDLTTNGAPPPKTAAAQDGKRLLLIALIATGVGLAILYLFNVKLFTLSLLMLRINLFAFGGGLSALPLMHHEIVSRGWLDSRAFIDGIALGQVTPGPISITGTFIGYLLFGLVGAVAATFATFFPSFMLLIISEPYYGKMKSSPLFARATKGIMSCFVGLLCYVSYKFARDIPWDLVRGLLVVGAFVALLRKIDVLLIVLLGAIYAVVLL